MGSVIASVAGAALQPRRSDLRNRRCRQDPDAPVGSIAINGDVALSTELDIASVMKRFYASGADELAVIDGARHVIGILSESHVRRRYAEELEKAQNDLFRER